MATEYITDAELTTALPADTAARATPAQVTAHAARVNAELDHALEQAGYTLPIVAGHTTAAIKGRLTDLARYRLALELQLLPEPAEASGFYLDAKAALEWLAGIATGKVQLELTDSSSDGDPGEIAAPAIATTSTRGWGGW